MSETQLILSRLDQVETTLRGDIKDLGGRMASLETQSAVHDNRLDRLDKDVDRIYSKRRRSEDEGKKGSRLGDWLELLIEAPKIWHIVVFLLTLLATIWGSTHVWLANQVAAETRAYSSDHAEHREHRLR